MYFENIFDLFSYLSYLFWFLKKCLIKRNHDTLIVTYNIYYISWPNSSYYCATSYNYLNTNITLFLKCYIVCSHLKNNNK